MLLSLYSERSALPWRYCTTLPMKNGLCAFHSFIHCPVGLSTELGLQQTSQTGLPVYLTELRKQGKVWIKERLKLF